MKRIYTILLIASTLFFFACQQEENLTGGATGYLRLTVNEDMSTNSRAVPENYKPEQIAVQIVNAEGETVKETEDWELWSGKQIELPVGKYTIKASSNGFDGKDAGFDIPYYTGSKGVTITANGEANETIICKLANVKVTVNFDPALIAKVRSVAATVDNDEVPNDGTPAVYSLAFDTEETRSGYFPVTKLFASITVVNKDGDSHSMRKELTDAEGNPVKARDHFILNIKETDTGEQGITVTVDPATHEYSYTFNVSTKPTSGATLTAGAWDRLAYLKASNVSTGTGVSAEGMKFQYRAAVETATLAEDEESGWTDVVTTTEENNHTAMLTGLAAETAYEYRLVNGNGEVIATQSFTTGEADAQTALVNGGFEDWCVRSAKTALTNKNTTFPCSETDYDAGNLYWDTSNRGANSISQMDPTNKSTDFVIAGTYAAKLQSVKVLGSIFAAASMYTGSFGGASMDMSATINFGRSFTSRPIALHGYYQYSPANVDAVGDNLPADATVSEGNPDQCAIYVALTKKTYTINNKQEDTFIDFEGDENIIAYGTIEGDYVKTNGAANGYTEFTIPLQYKESQFGAIPTHIIIVCSASKYGDYFTGGEGSTLYVDDFSLVYDGAPAIWKNK